MSCLYFIYGCVLGVQSTCCMMDIFMCGGCRNTYSVCLWEDKNSQRCPGENVQQDREWPRNLERSTHWPLHRVVVTIVMSNGLAQEPPWPNGQGAGLLIRRVRVQIPQGVRVSCLYFIHGCVLGVQSTCCMMDIFMCGGCRSTYSVCVCGKTRTASDVLEKMCSMTASGPEI